MFSSSGSVPDEMRAPPAVVEYARRLAQRGVSTIALVRAYRVGHGRFLTRCVEELASRTSDAAMNSAVTLRLVEISFRYIDRVSEELISVYQQERDRWLLAQTAVRAGRVRELLRGDPVDIATTESALGYRLRRHHLGRDRVGGRRRPGQRRADASGAAWREGSSRTQCPR